MPPYFYFWGPLTFWSVRNYCLYGSAKIVGDGEYVYFRLFLPLLSDKDKLFDDPELNNQFIKSVRGCEQYWKIINDADASAWQRRNNFEYYWLACRAPSNPFYFIARLTDPNWRPDMDHGQTSYTPLHMFKIAAVSEQIAVKIILNHPIEILS